MATNVPKNPAQRLIPGAYDRTTLTRRLPGSMGGAAFGSALATAGQAIKKRAAASAAARWNTIREFAIVSAD